MKQREIAWFYGKDGFSIQSGDYPLDLDAPGDEIRHDHSYILGEDARHRKDYYGNDIGYVSTWCGWEYGWKEYYITVKYLKKRIRRLWKEIDAIENKELVSLALKIFDCSYGERTYLDHDEYRNKKLWELNFLSHTEMRLMHVLRFVKVKDDDNNEVLYDERGYYGMYGRSGPYHQGFGKGMSFDTFKKVMESKFETYKKRNEEGSCMNSH